MYLDIAGFVIKLVFHKTKNPQIRDNLRQEIKQCTKEFITKKNPSQQDFILEFKGEDGIIYYKQKNKVFLYFYEERSKTKIITNYYIYKSQFLLILRHIIDRLLSKNGFIVHCSAGLVGKQAIVFIGPSGAGKSTIAELLKTQYPTLADDLGIIKKNKGNLYFFQTPFLEKNKNYRKNSQGILVGKICLLKKNKKCKLVRKRYSIDILKEIAEQIWTEKQEYTKSKLNLLMGIFSGFDNYYSFLFSKKREELINCFQKNK